MGYRSLEKERRYAVKTLSRYWLGDEELILDLPITKAEEPDSESLPPRVETVELPEWAEEIGVDEGLLVPSHFIAPGEGPAWSRTDWLGVIFWYLNGSAERAFEKLHGPIHSYAFRLKGWDTRLWERAWVNRIALFLRRWAAKEQGLSEQSLFGPLPAPEIILTHDVDAITKTMAIRLKQTAFHFFNAVRCLLRGRLGMAISKLTRAGRILFSIDDYWCFDHVTMLEEKHDMRSHFYIYGGLGGWRRSPKQLLLDPAYKVDNPRLKQQLRKMHANGWIIGLHQSFNAWADSESMIEERHRVEGALDAPVTTCRQHWLRFSWERTWKAQQEAGFVLDSTFGFNDRPAFRNGAALRFKPWDSESENPMILEVLPLVLMDSHLYDYDELTDDQRIERLDQWLDEIRQVHGNATVNWHQRVWARDYGWDKTYANLLESMLA